MQEKRTEITIRFPRDCGEEYKRRLIEIAAENHLPLNILMVHVIELFLEKRDSLNKIILKEER
jgi:hypothetical protein